MTFHSTIFEQFLHKASFILSTSLFYFSLNYVAKLHAILCLDYYNDILNYFWSKVDVQMPRNFGPFCLILRRY